MLLYLRDMNIIHGNLRVIYGHLCLKKVFIRRQFRNQKSEIRILLIFVTVNGEKVFVKRSLRFAPMNIAIP